MCGRCSSGSARSGWRTCERIHDVVGERVAAVFVTGTDFGQQHGHLHLAEGLSRPFHAVPPSRERLDPHEYDLEEFHPLVRLGDPLMPDFIEAGFDILNPVQTSAAHMDPQELNASSASRSLFWGGGVDTQRTLPFGTPDEVRARGARAHEDLRRGRRLRVQYQSTMSRLACRREPARTVRSGARLRKPSLKDTAKLS